MLKARGSNTENRSVKNGENAGTIELLDIKKKNNILASSRSCQGDARGAELDRQDPNECRSTQGHTRKKKSYISNSPCKDFNRECPKDVKCHAKYHKNRNSNAVVGKPTFTVPSQNESYEGSSKSSSLFSSCVQSSSFTESGNSSSSDSSCGDVGSYAKASSETYSPYSSGDCTALLTSFTACDEDMVRVKCQKNPPSRQQWIEKQAREHQQKMHNSRIRRLQSQNHHLPYSSQGVNSSFLDPPTESETSFSLLSLSTSRQREYNSTALMSSIDSDRGKDFFVYSLTCRLPFEIFIHMCSFLGEEDYRTLLEVNRSLACAITHADSFSWRVLCLRQWQYKQGFQNFVMRLNHLKQEAIMNELEILSLQQHMMMSAEQGCHHTHHHPRAVHHGIAAQRAAVGEGIGDGQVYSVVLDSARGTNDGYDYSGTKGSDMVSTYGNTTLLAHRRQDMFWRKYQHQLLKKKNKEGRQSQESKEDSRERSEGASDSTSTSTDNWSVNSEDRQTEEGSIKAKTPRRKHINERAYAYSHDDDSELSRSDRRDCGVKSFRCAYAGNEGKYVKKNSTVEGIPPNVRSTGSSKKGIQGKNSKFLHSPPRKGAQITRRNKIKGKGKHGHKHHQRGRNRQRGRCGQRAKLRRRRKKSSRKHRKKCAGHHRSKRPAIHKVSKSTRRKRRHRRFKKQRLLSQKQSEALIPYHVGGGYREEGSRGDLLYPTPTYAAIQSTTPALSAARHIVSSPIMRPAVLALPSNELTAENSQKYPRTPQIGGSEPQRQAAPSASELYWWEMNPTERQRVLCCQQHRRDKSFYDANSSSNQSGSLLEEDREKALWASFDLADAYTDSSFSKTAFVASASSKGVRDGHSSRTTHPCGDRGESPTAKKGECNEVVVPPRSDESSSSARPMSHTKGSSCTWSNGLIKKSTAKIKNSFEYITSSHARCCRNSFSERSSVSFKSDGEKRTRKLSRINGKRAAQGYPKKEKNTNVRRETQAEGKSHSSFHKQAWVREVDQAQLESAGPPSDGVRNPRVKGHAGKRELQPRKCSLCDASSNTFKRRNSRALSNPALQTEVKPAGDLSQSLEGQMWLTRSKSVLIHALTKYVYLSRANERRQRRGSREEGPPAEGEEEVEREGEGIPPVAPPLRLSQATVLGQSQAPSPLQLLQRATPPSASFHPSLSSPTLAPSLGLTHRPSEGWEKRSTTEIEEVAAEEEEVENVSPISWKFAYYMSRREARRSGIVLQDLLQGVWMVCFRKSGQTHPARFLRDRRLLVYPALFGPANNPLSVPAGRGGGGAGAGSEDLFGPPLSFHILHGGALLAVNNFDPLKVLRRSYLADTAVRLGAQLARTRGSRNGPHFRANTEAQNTAEAFAREPWDTLKRIRQEARRLQSEHNRGSRCPAGSLNFSKKVDASALPQVGDIWPSVEEVINRIKAQRAAGVHRTEPCGEEMAYQGDAMSRTTVCTAKTLEEHEAELAELQLWESGGVGDIDDDWGWTMSNLHVKIFSVDAQSPFYVESLRRIAGIGIV